MARLLNFFDLSIIAIGANIAVMKNHTAIILAIEGTCQ